MRVQRERYLPAVLVAIAMLLGGAQAAADPCGCCEQTKGAPDDNNGRPALGFGITADALFGTRWLGLGRVSATVARYGYARLPSTAVEEGGDVYFTGGRVRFGIEVTGGNRSTWRPDGGQKLPADSFDVAILLGYNVLSADDGSVFVSTGFAGGNLELDTRGKGLDELWKLHDDEGGVLRSYTGVPVQLGLQHHLRLGSGGGVAWLVRLGVRATWFQQLHGDWVAYSNKDGKGPRDISGPEVDLSGPGFMLSLGFGGADVKHPVVVQLPQPVYDSHRGDWALP